MLFTRMSNYMGPIIASSLFVSLCVMDFASIFFTMASCSAALVVGSVLRPIDAP